MTREVPAPRPPVDVAAVVGDLTGEQRAFLAREWVAADRALFGRDVDWASRPLVVEARAGEALAGIAAGEVVAGMARLNDLLVVPAERGRGVGSHLVREFCAHSAALGAGRCFLRCPATDRHRRFY